MRKIFAIIMSICLMANVLYITAFAANASAVLCVSGQKEDGTVVEIKSFSVFDDGWNYAMEKAIDHDWMEENRYTRIVVDLLTDWNAVDGEFTDEFFNGKGFDWDAIYFYDDAKITLNMNNHTINRGLTDNEYNGEVMCVDEGADVIINDGTITGGNSDNGAGGIHIKEKAKVTLNNVNIVNNITDGDDGGGIAVYEATLIMNGGSFVGNINDSFENNAGAAVYLNDSTATFNKVRFYDNQFTLRTGFGAAVYATGSTVTMTECEITGNGLCEKIGNVDGNGSYSTIHARNGSTFTIKKSTIKENGAGKYVDDVAPAQSGNHCSLIRVDNSAELFIDECTIEKNFATYYIFQASYVNIYISNTTIINNLAPVFVGHHAAFTNCTFNDNTQGPTFKVLSSDKSVIFTDCEMGNSTYNDINIVKFEDTDAKNGVGSVFGEGSPTMLVAFLALIVSAASLCTTVIYNKKKAAPAAASNAAETEDEE